MVWEVSGETGNLVKLDVSLCYKICLPSRDGERRAEEGELTKSRPWEHTGSSELGPTAALNYKHTGLDPIPSLGGAEVGTR